MKEFSQIAPAEYGCFFLEKITGIPFHYVTAKNPPVLSPIPGISGIKSMSCGLHNAAALGEDGRAYIIFRPSAQTGISSVREIAGIPIKAVSSASQWEKHVVVTGVSEVYIIDEREMIPRKMVNLRGKILAAAAGGNLCLLNDLGEVLEYGWNVNKNSAGQMTAQTVANLQYKITKLPGQPSHLTSSREGFTFAVINGEIWGWSGANWSWLLGKDKAVTTPLNMSTAWGLKEKVIDIAAGDNTLHFVTESGKLYGLGNNGQGEVGNGEQLATVLLSFNYDPFGQGMLKVTTPVHIAQNRKFVKVWKGTTMAYYTYAQEQNGLISFWGRNKVGVGAFGIFAGGYGEIDSKKPNLMNVLRPTRVGFPEIGKFVDEAFFKSAEYPPKEPADPAPPPVEPAKRKLVARIDVFDNGDVEKVVIL